MVFKSGQFDPGSDKGQRTIAHELAHVVQQSSGPVDGTDAPGGIRVSSPSTGSSRPPTTPPPGDGVRLDPAIHAGRGGDGGTVAQLEEAEDAAIPAVQREELPEERRGRVRPVGLDQALADRVRHGVARLRSSRRDVTSWMMFLTVRSE